MRKFMFVVFGMMLLMFVSCDKQPPKLAADKAMTKETEQAMIESYRELGMPAIFNWTEKRTMKWIYELCDQENLICHAYLFNEFEGKVGQYLGECIGYGIPYSTQYSNPEKLITGGYSGSYWAATIPQPEPNGVFKPIGLSATWLIMIDPKTKEPRPLYIEPAIIVSPFKLHE